MKNASLHRQKRQQYILPDKCLYRLSVKSKSEDVTFATVNVLKVAWLVFYDNLFLIQKFKC